MPDITFPLDEKVGQILAIEAQRRGVSPYELIRWVLGSWVIGELQSMPHFAAAPLLPTNAPNPDQVMATGMKDVGKLMRMGAAMMGQLTCQRCTQRLSMSDVEKGSCSHCESPVE